MMATKLCTSPSWLAESLRAFVLVVCGCLACTSALAEDAESRSWVVESPSFEPHLSDEGPGLRADGALMWQHLLDVPVGRATGVRWGVRYVSKEMYRLHAELGFKVIASGPTRTDDLKMARKYGLQTVPEAARVTRLGDGEPLYILHPQCLSDYFASVDAFLNHPDASMMWGIFAGDEDDDVAVYRAADLKRNPGKHDYFHQFDRAVRTRFGGGRWGIPAGTKSLDPNPYKWIALYRFVAAELRERQRRFFDMIKSRNERLVVIPFDSPGGIYPTEWSELAPYGDLFTLQMGYPGGSNRWRATAGFHSKVVSDLTGKDFWPCLHFEHYDYPHSRPHEVLEEVSQVLRNGGTGVHLYLPDTRNLSKKGGDLRTTYFSSPPRYHTVMNIARLLRTMPRLRLPAYDRSAIVYNDDTLASRPHDGPDVYGVATQVCYTFLGPVAKSWFKFVDSGQLAKWSALHSRFDVIYLPAAKYQRVEIAKKLHQFVVDGGTLVALDPEAFQTDLLGNKTSDLRLSTFGVTVGRELAVKSIDVKLPDWSGELAVRGPALKIEIEPEIDVLARFEDGSPAITVNRVGAGRAIFFATNVLRHENVADANWRDFFTALPKFVGSPAGFKIWDFRLPDRLIWREPVERGVCLTNNRVRWREERPLVDGNVDCRGTYSFSVPPDVPLASVRENEVPFSRGRLTDRRSAILAEKEEARPYVGYALPESHWIVQWSEPKPVSMTFDVRETRRLLAWKVWFRDTLPNGRLLGSADGTTWTVIGQVRHVQGHPGDVYDLSVPLAERGPIRYLRVDFEARQPGEKLTLAEVEIWGAGESASHDEE